MYHVIGGQPLVVPSSTLEDQIHRVWMRRTLRALCLGGNEFGIERVAKPRYDFVLHVKEVGNGLVKTLGPEVIAGFGIDQLHVHPKAVAATLHRAFEHIADVQLTSQLLYVDRLALEGERGVARNHERAIDTRQIRSQALGYAIRKIVLLGTAAYIGERQHHQGQARGRSWRRSS